jgi:hypothetical protein
VTAGGAPWLILLGSDAGKDLSLLRRELLLGQDPGIAELSQLSELCHQALSGGLSLALTFSR